jgi:hypothetical protein
MGDGRGFARRVAPVRARRFVRVAVVAGVGALVVGVAAAIAAIAFDGSPGTAAPPATLGGYTMTPFAADPQALGVNVSSVAAPVGSVGFSPSLSHRRVGAAPPGNWLTWSHGYTGDVYFATGTTATLTLPANTVAFYLYVEPNILGSANVTATSNGGITSGPVSVDGNAGAKYFGFYATGADTLTSITVDVPAPALGFAVGEFGIAYRQLANNPPDCSKVKPDRTALWPPNHKFQIISLSGLTDPDGDPTTLTITGVTQDEPINGLGDGDASPDAATAGSPSKVQIRAERSGKGDGRVYAINFTGADNRGGSCTGTVRVTVGHGAKGQPVDSGQKYNSFGP